MDEGSDPKFQIAEFSVGEGIVIGRVLTVGDYGEGVPDETAVVKLMGATTLDGNGFSVINENVSLDKEGRFTCEVDPENTFFKMSISVGTEFFK